MRKLHVELLDPKASVPTVAYRGEDLGYDIYALEDTFLLHGIPAKIRTGIAAVYVERRWYQTLSQLLVGPGLANLWPVPRYGLEIEDRSGNAAKFGLHCLAGKVDSGYRGEIMVVMMLLGRGVEPRPAPAIAPGKQDKEVWGYQVHRGDKIAQLLPREILTAGVKVERKLPQTARGAKGFGSSGR